MIPFVRRTGGTGGQTGSYPFSQTSNHLEDLSEVEAAARGGVREGKLETRRQKLEMGKGRGEGKVETRRQKLEKEL